MNRVNRQLVASLLRSLTLQLRQRFGCRAQINRQLRSRHFTMLNTNGTGSSKSDSHSNATDRQPPVWKWCDRSRDPGNDKAGPLTINALSHLREPSAHLRS